MGRLRLIGALGAACLALALTACGGGDGGGSSASTGGDGGTTKITVGTIPITDLLQFYVAQDKGYFKEEGLDVEAKSMSGGAAIAAAVQGGAIDIGWSNGVSIYQAHTRGLDFKYVAGGLFQGPGHWTQAIMVPKGSSITSIDQLSGKKVAVNTLGNINTLVMKAVLDHNGMSPDAARLVEVPFPEMQSSLQSGRVDAGLPTEPFVTLIGKSGGKVIDPTPFEVLGDHPFVAAWFASSKWIEDNPDTVAAFQRAIKKATDYIDAHPKSRAQILPKYTKVTADLAKKIHFGLNQAELSPEDLQPTIDLSAKYKLIPQSFDASEILATGGEGAR